MKPDVGHDPRLPIWTYGYALIRPVARDRMGPMEVLLEEGHTRARGAARTWEGRLIEETEITHILIVCDTPDRHLEINELLEAELDRLDAPFLVTQSILVQGSSRTDHSAGSEP